MRFSAPSASIFCILAGATLLGCQSTHSPRGGMTPKLQPVTVSDSALPKPGTGPITLAAAKNEWTSFALEVSDLPAGAGFSLELGPLTRKNDPTAKIPVSSYEPYQILLMPVDVNRAGYVRHTGLACCSAGQLPRALLPAGNGTGTIDFASLRDAAHPTDPNKHPAGHSTIHLWVDLHVPADTPAGDYEAVCEIVPTEPENKSGAFRSVQKKADEKQSDAKKPDAKKLVAKKPDAKKPDAGKSQKTQPALTSVPLRLTVHDFALPEERHLQMVSQVSWESLARYFPQDFETVTPRLIARDDRRYTGTVRMLDALVAEARRNRLAVFFPKLQPTVKWPPLEENAAPDIDWRDYDSLVGPWLSGDGADKAPLGYWPLPEPDYLRNYDVRSRLLYWSLATTHFDQNDWLAKTAVVLQKQRPGRVNTGDSLELSAEASGLLRSHARLRVTVPMEDEQVQLADPNNRATDLMVHPAHAVRLLSASPSFVFNPPDQEWPDGPDAPRRPAHWLRTDLPGLVPYVGAGGDEHDVRVWAWLAFLRRASLVTWGPALPTWKEGDEPGQDATRSADPNEMIWFYPGSWFGADKPVPTVQLKWLRRAQQDYEYLWLAKERGETVQAMQMARLITKPVEIPRDQVPDPTYSLMSGTTDADAWSTAEKLLGQTILLHPPDVAADKTKQEALYVQTLLWQAPQERPLLIGRTARWTMEPVGARDARPGTWLKLQTGLDIYNAADVRRVQNLLQWTVLPAAWEVRPQPIEVPKLATYRVSRATLDSRVNLDKVTAESRKPLELQFIDGFTNTRYPLKLMLPVATSERLEGRFTFDGKLDNWNGADAILNGPMVRMLDRSSLQKQQLQYASTPTQLFTGWAGDNFYVAFGVGGVAAGDSNGGQNFVDYQARRAWGEDLCEVLIQPVYSDNSAGPVLQVVCKPNGSNWVERKLDPRLNANPWVPFLGTGIRYVAALQPAKSKWTGELAIPWEILSDPTLGAPTLLRFNFCQHRHATGESASWAGPIDFGRDDDYMGAVYLNPPSVPGMVDADHPNKPDPRSPTHVEQ